MARTEALGAGAPDKGEYLMPWNEEGEKLVKRIGPTWCFTHSGPLPCEECAAVEKDHPFVGRCFDCKAEYAAKGESGTRSCSCFNGCMVREVSRYRYP